MKVRHVSMGGRLVIESVGGAVMRIIGQSPGYGDGQIEQLQAELNATQEFLGRLCDIVGESLTREEIFQLLGRNPQTNRHDRFEVAERFCVYCGNEAEGEHAIHRDGLGEGPEVDLCNHCGSTGGPTCEQIWKKIAAQR